MSEKQNYKQDGAIRLFGALSGVDEKYLVACENEKKQGGVVVFMHKYGKAMAAVLCLAVLGAGYMAMQTSVKYNDCATSEAPQAVAGAGAERNEAKDMEAAASDAPEADGMEESVLENAEQLQDSTSSEHSAQSSATVEMTLTEARVLNVVGQYIPTDWPTGGVVSQVLGFEKAGEASVTLFWTYNETKDGFFINIDNLGEELPDWVTEEISEDYIVAKEDFTKEYVESQMKSASETDDKDVLTGRFGILYEDASGYVLVRFNGSGNVDEIWELMN